MNFTRMHENLRLECLRRIRRGTLSVSLLARQSGFGQSHISNFLRSRRQLSLEAMDRVLLSQHMTLWDLLPIDSRRGYSSGEEENDAVPLVSHAVALFEPFIRPSVVQAMIHVPLGTVASDGGRGVSQRKKWRRFVALSISAADALPMEPIIQPEAIVVVDRHYISLIPYRPGVSNIYAVRNGGRLALRYADFLASRLVLRPHNLASPVDLLEVPPGNTPADLIAGRVAFIHNQA